MIRRPRLRLGIFGRTYGLVLSAVLGAELLIFSAMVLTAPPLPPIIEFPRLLYLLDGKGTDTAGVRVEMGIADKPPPASANKASAALTRSIEHSLGLQPGDVRVSIAGIGPPSPFGPQPVETVERGTVPMVLAGEFVVARRLPDGRWRTVTSDPSFVREASIRIGLLLLGTLALVLPAAYFLARHSVRPIRRFAEAAERLGRDPHAPPLAEEGPEEIRVASEAFNRMQRRLTSYIEERTTMVAAVAHDLRTPLMRMAFEIEDAPAEVQQALSVQIREMRELTDAIMRFLRAEQSRHDREAVDIAGLLAEVVGGFAAEGDDVRIDAIAGPVTVAGDPVGLKSVFRNVIGNAVIYGGEVAVQARALDDRVIVVVRDKGPGLSDDDLQNVFQPFYRVEKSRNRATGGIGLGLAVARSIIVAHGGEIRLANLETGGLEATIELPLINGEGGKNAIKA